MRSTRLPKLGPRGEGWVVLQGVLFVVFVLAAMFGPRWPDAIEGPLLAAGIAIAILGGIQATAGLLGLGRSLTALPHPRPDGTLRTGGVYGMVRHPIYGGLVLVLVGGSLTNSPLALVPAALLALLFESKRRVEEVWLEAHYEGYADYARQVPRAFIPGIW